MSQVGSDNEEEQGVTTTVVSGLDEALESLSEKRTSTREGALETFIRSLKENYLADFVANKKVTLVEAIKRGLKKGSEKEQILSGTLMSLLCVTLGTETEEYFRELAPTYEEIILNSPHDQVKAETLSNYAVMCFISNPDQLENIAKMEFFRSIFEKSTSKPLTQTAALNAWRLLATTVERQYIYDNVIPNDLPALKNLLASDSVDVRVAAGECIALLFEVARELKEDLDLDDFGSYAGIDVDELIDTLHQLSADKTKQRSKKEKQKQKTPFKDITATVEEGEEPSEVLVFKHQKISFNSWAELTQLNVFRDLLAIGLHSHWESNELLHDIFGVDFNKQATKKQMTQLEKRMYLGSSSPFAKERTKNMSKQRSTKTRAEDLHQTDEA